MALGRSCWAACRTFGLEIAGVGARVRNLHRSADATSRALAAALDPYDGQALPLGCYDLVLPVLDKQLTWQRKPSRARFDSMVLAWPAVIYELRGSSSRQWQQPHGYLIGDDCPSFPSYETAFRAFFYGEFARLPSGPVPSEFAIVRVVEGSAWLDRVVITPTALEVYVDGSDVAGSRVELNSANYQNDARVSAVSQTGCPF